MALNVTAAWPEDDRIMDLFLSKPAFLLARVDQICTALYGPLSAGETLAQAEFLLLLALSDERDQISLARAAGVDKSTTALILDNLAGHRLIERVPDRHDRRRTRPRLTALGRDRAAGIHAGYAALQAQLTAPVADPAELVALLAALASDGAAPAWIGANSPLFLASAPSLLGRRALQVAQARFLACTAPLSLTPRQYSVLVILAARPGLSQIDFCRLFGLDPATAGLVMRKLVARDLIGERRSATDRRRRIHTLTAPGEALLAAARPLVAASERLVVDGLTGGEIARLTGHLRSIVFAHSHRLRFPGEIGTPVVRPTSAPATIGNPA